LTSRGPACAGYRQASSQRKSPEKNKSLEKGKPNMGYIQDLEGELRERIDGMDQEELIKFFKEKVLDERGAGE
jgi:hypothetical protein